MKNFVKNILAPMGMEVFLLALWFAICAIADVHSGLYQ